MDNEHWAAVGFDRLMLILFTSVVTYIASRVLGYWFERFQKARVKSQLEKQRKQAKAEEEKAVEGGADEAGLGPTSSESAQMSARSHSHKQILLAKKKKRRNQKKQRPVVTNDSSDLDSENSDGEATVVAESDNWAAKALPSDVFRHVLSHIRQDPLRQLLSILSIERTCASWREAIWSALFDLDIDCEAGYFDDKVLQCLSFKPLHNLRAVSTFGIHSINSFAPITALLHQCQALSRLDLSFFEDGYFLTGKNLRVLLEPAKNITELELSNFCLDSEGDGQEVFATIATMCPALKELAIICSPSQGRHTNAVSLRYSAMFPLLRLEALEYLAVHGIEASWIGLRNHQNLRVLDFGTDVAEYSIRVSKVSDLKRLTPAKVGLNLISGKQWIGHVASNLDRDHEEVVEVFRELNACCNADQGEFDPTVSPHQYLRRWIHLRPPMVDVVREVEFVEDILERLEWLHEVKCSPYEQDASGRDLFDTIRVHHPNLVTDPRIERFLQKIK